MAGGFSALSYEHRVLSLADALAYITSWDRVSAIAAFVQRGDLPERETIARYVDAFPPGPLYIIAFSLSTLGRIFPADWAGRTGERLVIWDGNKRLSALAIRHLRGNTDELAVNALIGS